MHISCFSNKIASAFSDVIGTEDDWIDELVSDACTDALTDHIPVSEYGGV